jgi:DNA repair exonuclease SbcCD nuclease subunit
MLTLAHIADTHHGHRQYGLKQREDDMVSTTGTALQEMVDQRDADAILLPGDLFHSRDLRPKVLQQTEQQLAQVPEDVPVLVSRGNHDENLTPRDVTWMNYLYQRGHIVFLEVELGADSETAWFGPHEPERPGESSGFYDIDVDGVDAPVRVFGLLSQLCG